MGRGFHVVTLCTLSRDVMQCYVIDTRSIAVHAMIGMGVRIMCYLKSREIAAAHYRDVFKYCQCLHCSYQFQVVLFASLCGVHKQM